MCLWYNLRIFNESSWGDGWITQVGIYLLMISGGYLLCEQSNICRRGTSVFVAYTCTTAVLSIAGPTGAILCGSYQVLAVVRGSAIHGLITRETQ